VSLQHDFTSRAFFDRLPRDDVANLLIASKDLARNKLTLFTMSAAALIELKDMIEPKAHHQLPTPRIGIDDFQPEALAAIRICGLALDILVIIFLLRQAESHTRQCSHECGVHHGAVFEVHNEMAVSFLDHFRRKLLDGSAILKGPFAFDADPDGAFKTANENWI
jgi:hypothetical protein